MQVLRFVVVAATSTILVQPAFAVFGYLNYQFHAGENLFANPFNYIESDESDPSDTLSILFEGQAPDGTTVSLWNPETQTFDVSSTLISGQWSNDLVLIPGIGARLTAPSSFANYFLGEILDRDGTTWDGLDPDPNAPLFSGPDGIYLLADRMPFASSGSDIFLHVLGRLPSEGERVLKLASTHTYLGSGNWDTVPTLAAGEAAWFDIGPTVSSDADFDNDGDVDGSDFLKWQRGESPNPYSQADLSLWESQYGNAVLNAAETVPEPSGALLVAMAAVCCMTRRGHRGRGIGVSELETLERT